MKYDIVIIGGGPAGLMAARALASSGAKFLVIDPKNRIGEPLKCGEGLRERGFLELFKDLNYPFVKNRVEKIVVVCGRIKRELSIKYIVLDRPGFEKWLAAPFRDKIILRTKCNDIAYGEDGLVVYTNRGEIEAEMAILANGCDYTIQKKLGLIRKMPLLVPCYGGIFAKHGLDAKRLYFFFDEANSAIVWAFPKDNRTANVGAGILPRSRKNVKAILRRYTSGMKPVGRQAFGGAFPTSGPIRRTYAERIIVCGNAAGQVYAGTGEGIYFALKAGQIAGKIAAQAVSRRDFSSLFMKKYEKGWKKSFGNQLKASLVFANILSFGFKYKKLEKICALPNERELINLFMHGKVCFRARIANAVSKLFILF